MAEKREIVGYYTDDGNIYCVDCINKVKRGQATFSSTQVSLKSRSLCIPRNSPIIFFRKSSLSPF